MRNKPNPVSGVSTIDLSAFFRGGVSELLLGSLDDVLLSRSYYCGVVYMYDTPSENGVSLELPPPPD